MSFSRGLANESLAGWTKAVTGPRLRAAVVDRLTLGRIMIATTTHSRRLACIRNDAAGENLCTLSRAS